MGRKTRKRAAGDDDNTTSERPQHRQRLRRADEYAGTGSSSSFLSPLPSQSTSHRLEAKVDQALQWLGATDARLSTLEGKLVDLTTIQAKSATAAVAAADGVQKLLDEAVLTTNVNRGSITEDCPDYKDIRAKLEEIRAMPRTSAAKSMLRAYLVLLKTSRIPNAPASVLDALLIARNSRLAEIPLGVKSTDLALTVVASDDGGRVLDRVLRKAAKLSIDMLAASTIGEVKRLFIPGGLLFGSNEWMETSRFNNEKFKGPVKAVVSILRELARPRRQEARRTLFSSISIFLCSVEGGEPRFEPLFENMYDATDSGDNLSTTAAPGESLGLGGAIPDVATMCDDTRYIVSVRTHLTVKNKSERIEQEIRLMEVAGAVLLASFVDGVTFRRASFSAASVDEFLRVAGERFRRQALMLVVCVAESLRKLWSSMRYGHLSDADRNLIGVKEYTQHDAECCPVLSEMIMDFRKVCEERSVNELRDASNANEGAVRDDTVASRYDNVDDDDNILTQEN